MQGFVSGDQVEECLHNGILDYYVKVWNVDSEESWLEQNWWVWNVMLDNIFLATMDCKNEK